MASGKNDERGKPNEATSEGAKYSRQNSSDNTAKQSLSRQSSSSHDTQSYSLYQHDSLKSHSPGVEGPRKTPVGKQKGNDADLVELNRDSGVDGKWQPGESGHENTKEDDTGSDHKGSEREGATGRHDENKMRILPKYESGQNDGKQQSLLPSHFTQKSKDDHRDNVKRQSVGREMEESQGRVSAWDLERGTTEGSSADRRGERGPSLVLGVDLDKLNRLQLKEHVEPAEDGAFHAVLLCRQPVEGSKPTRRWDLDHVRMPYDSAPMYKDSTFPSLRWNNICTKLTECRNIKCGNDLKNIILSYNDSYRGKWSFDVLVDFVDGAFTTYAERQELVCTLDRMAELASDLMKLCPKPIPLLKKERPYSLTFSQRQIACLLANAFFCTFPSRNADPSAGYRTRSNNGMPVLPSINFSGLFRDMPGREHSQRNKLRCLFHYFKRVTDKLPDGNVTFQRQFCKTFPNFISSPKHFTKLHVRCEGSIEETGEGMLQVDFANKLVGGGVIGRGCVQEEIRFIICPDLIVSRLFTEELSEREVLIITGAERYCKFKGYGNTFEFDGDFQDDTISDGFGRKLTQIVAMDAKKYKNREEQFNSVWIKRELEKAFCGFFSPLDFDRSTIPAVATGNWGCGAFGGDRHLKSLIQLMAAAETGRDVLYITIDDNKLVKDLYDVHTFITKHNLSIGNVYALISQYISRGIRRNDTSLSLFEFILRCANNSSGQPMDTN